MRSHSAGSCTPRPATATAPSSSSTNAPRPRTPPLRNEDAPAASVSGLLAPPALRCRWSFPPLRSLCSGRAALRAPCRAFTHPPLRLQQPLTIATACRTVEKCVNSRLAFGKDLSGRTKKGQVRNSPARCSSGRGRWDAPVLPSRPFSGTSFTLSSFDSSFTPWALERFPKTALSDRNTVIRVNS